MTLFGLLDLTGLIAPVGAVTSDDLLMTAGTFLHVANQLNVILALEHGAVVTRPRERTALLAAVGDPRVECFADQVVA